MFVIFHVLLSLFICPLSRDSVYHPEEKIGLLQVQFGYDTEVVPLNHCAPLEMLCSLMAIHYECQDKFTLSLH